MTAALVDHLWQSSLVVVVAALLARLLRTHSARLRHAVWLAASLKFLIPFSLLISLGVQMAPREVGSSHAMAGFVASAVRQAAEPFGAPEVWTNAAPAKDLPLGGVLLAIWLAGSAALLVRWLVQWMRVSIAARRATPVGREGSTEIRSTPRLSEPSVVGVFHPVLLLPRGIEARLTPAQLRLIIAHELCHVRRRDNLTSAIHMLVEVLFWFHPLVWWIGTRLVDERERACDEAVVSLGEDPRIYAEGILEVCRFYVESGLVCAAGISGASLKKRIEGIMRNRVTVNLSATKKLLLASAMAGVIAVPLVTGLLAAEPAHAQAADQAHLAFDRTLITKATPEAARRESGTRLNTRELRLTRQGEVSVRNQSLRQLIAVAYDLEVGRVVGGPAWLDRPLYDISGVSGASFITKPDSEKPQALRSMVRAMLADRFGLLAHREAQPLAALVLHVDRAGTTLKEAAVPSAEPGPTGIWQLAGGPQLFGRYVDTRQLAGFLSKAIGHPVIDQTGLTGHFDFTLSGAAPPDTWGAATWPSILREQLGLVLEPSRDPVDATVLVIDFVQAPTLDTAA